MNIKSISEFEPSFTSNIVMHNRCNYSCTYCPKDLHDGSTPLITAQEYIHFFSNLFEDNPEILSLKYRKVCLTGGEPSLYPNIGDVISFFRSSHFKIVMISNGSTKMSFWRKTLGSVDILILSFHPRYEQFKHFAEVVEKAKEKTNVVVNVIMDPKYWGHATEAAEYLKGQNILIHRKRLYDWGAETAVYTDDQLNYLKDDSFVNKNKSGKRSWITYEDGSIKKINPRELIINDLNHFKDWKCDAGSRFISISRLGDVKAGVCGAYVFGNLNQNKNLRVSLFKKPLTCEFDTCRCVADVAIHKWKENPRV